MNDGIEAAVDAIMKRWTGKTLESFRRDAEKELNGSAFDAFRESDGVNEGPRLLLAICVTGERELALVENIFDFTDTGAPQDWATYSLADMLRETLLGEGLSYQDLERGGERLAVVVIASRREKVALLEKVFSLP